MARVVGTERADRLFGTNDDDVFFTRGGGSDLVRTGGGRDRIVLEGDDGAFVVSSDFDPGRDVFDLTEAGISRDDVRIVETSTGENDVANSGLSGLGGVEVQIAGAETIVLPQFNNADALDLDRDFIFADDGAPEEDVSVVDTSDDPEDDPIVADEADDEEVAAAPEIDEGDSGDDQPVADNDIGDRNVIDASGDAPDIATFTFSQRINGTDDADLILTSGRLSSFVNAGGGDDVVVLEGNSDVVNLGEGRDTVVLSDNGGTALAAGRPGDATFRASEDVIDFSRVSGVDSIDDVTLRVIDDVAVGSEDFGLFEVVGGNSTSLIIRADQGLQLDEDNFIFADDDVAVG